ncbi:hypothetical protein TNCV_4963741 [Trichonephila clavipes]|nr:hypothetical protein TNCV_4963741 [Trichonephila clavipes]
MVSGRGSLVVKSGGRNIGLDFIKTVQFRMGGRGSLVVKESDPVDDENDEDEDNNNNGSSKDPSNAEAFSALETAIECGTNNNQSSVLLNYCSTRESEILQLKTKGVQ